MENTNFRFLLLFLLMAALGGCSSRQDIYSKINDYPHEIEKVIASPKGDKSVVVVKMGVEGGATVPFAYYFIFSDNKKDLFVSARFLWVRGLESYTINWVADDEIDVTIKATRIVDFESQPFIKREDKFTNYTVRNLFYHKVE